MRPISSNTFSTVSPIIVEKPPTKQLSSEMVTVPKPIADPARRANSGRNSFEYMLQNSSRREAENQTQAGDNTPHLTVPLKTLSKKLKHMFGNAERDHIELQAAHLGIHFPLQDDFKPEPATLGQKVMAAADVLLSGLTLGLTLYANHLAKQGESFESAQAYPAW